MSTRVAMALEEAWYGAGLAPLALAPLAAAWGLVARARRGAYLSGLASSVRLPVPVIVVGGITVGGSGKTPMVAWLASWLRAWNYRPGIVCRGYRGRARHWPQQVRPDSDPAVVGDEAVLLARRAGCPVAAGPDRVASAQSLIEVAGCDIIVSDDGLQHYRLARDIEIAMVDGHRRFGNGRLLPAGPLREPVRRLKTVDIVVTNGIAGRGEFAMRVRPGALRRVDGRGEPVPAAEFEPREVHAVTGIALPERFFAMLRGAGLRVHRHPFPDHHWFRAEDLTFDDDLPVVMTEKDAVKCARLATPAHWYLPIEAELPALLERRLVALLNEVRDGQEAA